LRCRTKLPASIFGQAMNSRAVGQDRP
jgi:hypothetical protein